MGLAKRFKKYQHIERFGTEEVLQIELGDCYIFPKIDGTNASVWLEEGVFCAGSRTRELDLDNDNAGFYAWVIEQSNIKEYLIENPNHRLFGEWLVPHSLKTYRSDSWRRFYVFDVAIDNEDGLDYLSYESYKAGLEKHNIDYIPPIAIIHNGSYEQLIDQLSKNVFLIEDGKGCGEGIVIKNYNFKNKYQRQVWAKIVTSEFKEKHAKEMGAPEVAGKKMVEEEIVNEFVTTALCEKVFSKVTNEHGDWSSKYIPQLLNTVFYDLVNENSWEYVKKHKNPTINFNTLKHFTFNKVKEILPERF